MATTKKKTQAAVPAVKDPTRYVVATLSLYEDEISGSRCKVRACNGDGLRAAIKATSEYDGEDYIVVMRVEKIVKVPLQSPTTAKSLAGVPVEEWSK